MARSIRIEYPGAYYHVMARGNRRETIYRDDQDQEFFLKRSARGTRAGECTPGVETTTVASRFHIKGKLTAINEAAPEGGYWAICPEIPGANGQARRSKRSKKV